MSSWPKVLTWLVLLHLLILSCYRVQVRLEEIRPRDRAERMLYLPSGKLLKPMALGFDNLLADILWVRAVIYVGSHILTDKRYPWLYHILDLVTTLDPRFDRAFEFGGIVLAMEEKAVDQSIAILKKGMQYHPRSWRFPFYLGFDYFHLLGDPKTAARYLELAARLPDCPPYIPRLAASMKYKVAGKEEAIHFLEEMMANVRSPQVKEELRKKIELLRRGELPKAFKPTEGQNKGPLKGLGVAKLLQSPRRLTSNPWPLAGRHSIPG